MDKKPIKKTENDFIFAKVLGEVRKIERRNFIFVIVLND
jgi:hypothetical protein